MNKIFSKAKLSSAFLLLTLAWGIDILFEKLTPQKKGVEFEKHLQFAHYVYGVGDFIDDLFFDFLITGLF